MKVQTLAGGPGYLLILVGIVLSALAAVVPFFHDGYVLQFSVLLAGILPWLVYGIAVPLMPGALTNTCGLLLIIAQGWLVVTERYMGSANYSNNAIYLVPVILSVVLLPLAVTAMLRSR